MENLLKISYFSPVISSICIVCTLKDKFINLITHVDYKYGAGGLYE